MMEQGQSQIEPVSTGSTQKAGLSNCETEEVDSEKEKLGQNGDCITSREYLEDSDHHEGCSLRQRKHTKFSQEEEDQPLVCHCEPRHEDTKLVEDPTGNETSLLNVPGKCAEQAEEFVRKVWAAGLNVVHHHSLPDWLKDNEYLLRGHRVPTNSFRACFRSIFGIHTETGNIWTHLLGMIAFLGIAAYFLTRPSFEIQWQEKIVFSPFFLGAILCLGFSWVFHTVSCHSEEVGRFFHKLDYCGIALMIIGSFVPWLYYSFYCRLEPKVTYLSLIIFLGTLCIGVSMWDKFSKPHFRPFRAGVFVALGLSGIIPAMHYVITDGFWHAFNFAAMGWLALMAFLYILGAIIYAARIPECIFPGKCDIVFQSHQIFHVFVIAAAFVHYHGISEIANYRLSLGECVAREV